MEMHPREQAVTLLYVEDEEITRETVCTMLARRFPELAIQSAADGATGLRLFTELAPDLVITDVKMPGMNGIEMARRILEQESSVPVIVTSAHSDMEYLIDSIEIGISRYVMKPIDSGKLFTALERCLASVRMAKELKLQQEFVRKLSRAVEQCPNSIVITDPDGVIEYANPKYSQLTGYSEAELLGQNLRALQEPGDAVWQALAAGSEWRGELEGCKKGGEAYTESVSISPVLNDEGKVSHLVAVKDDITEKKRSARQIELLNRSLATRAQELEAANRDLESFSYTVSHDLRTPLTNINGYCQVILEIYGESLDDECRRFIQVMLNETVTMNRLIKTLLEFSQLNRSELNVTETDLSQMAQLIAGTLTLAHPQRKLRFDIAEGITVQGDPDLLKVALDNLLGNACKYSARKEEARIEFGVTGAGSDRTYFVRDNGAGFDMSNSDKLFDPFQRLHGKDEFHGFGIGLATVQRILKRHGGRIWAEGEVGTGATFYFTLPKRDEAVPTPVAA